jgi:EAL domain-containing protein (putative c-di-GMP-specific phosphodiesterase class I)
VQLEVPTYVADVAAVIRESGLTPERLILEVSESSLLKDLERTARILRDLRELGVRVAIDDFGTGYVWSSYLSRLPVDLLKVDGAFVSGESAMDPALLETIFGMGHTLSLLTLAEGVEDKDQLPVLAKYGCDLAQGFGLSKPLSAADATRVLEKRREAGAA